MFSSYLKIALRNMIKNRIYAAINILGLALGLTVYLFGGIVAEYESNHDTMFANHERTYTIGSLLAPEANIGVKELNNTYSAMGPLLAENLPEAESVARTIRNRFLVSVNDRHFNETIKFADPDLTNIFDFQYIVGDASALQDPKGLILTRETAEKLFGDVNVVGQTMLLDQEHDMTVRAVIENVPQNTHFNSDLISSDPLTMLGPLVALNRITGWDLAGNWNNLSTGNHVYVMTHEPMTIEELSPKVNAIFNAHAEDELKEKFMTGTRVRHLKDTNNSIWDMLGMPVISSVQLLGFMVLVIAIVNYTNLAIAQSMGRTREVGMRKTLGATRGQLLVQFLTESLLTVSLAMVLSIAMLELAIPVFNSALGKVVSLNYISILPWLLLTTLLVGLVAGVYPSYLITKVNPTAALKGSMTSGAKGSKFRSSMIGLQFMLSIFMMSLVMIVFFQNQKIREGSEIFPKDEVLTLKRLSKESIRDREEVLRAEFKRHPAVETVTFATQVPFEQSNNRNQVNRDKGDDSVEFLINNLVTDEEFLKTFDIPLLAGRNFSREVSADLRLNNDDRSVNVIVNAMAASKLGFNSPQEAVGKTFWSSFGGEENDDYVQFDIIGVVADQNIQGLHNDIKPWKFSMEAEQTHFYAALRLKPGADGDTIAELEQIWKTVLPDFPMEHQFLSGLFEDVYQIMKTMGAVLGGFALMAVVLALIGLFGLAAFMARGRTKEVGIRKVLGADVSQIVKLMIWQFSRPVMWALLIALPLAYVASGGYLDFFAERITIQIPLIIGSGALAILLAWGVIALHALKIARQNPIKALRYE